MGRRVVGEGYVVPLGLLPSPTILRLFAILLWYNFVTGFAMTPHSVNVLGGGETRVHVSARAT